MGNQVLDEGHRRVSKKFLAMSNECRCDETCEHGNHGKENEVKQKALWRKSEALPRKVALRMPDLPEVCQHRPRTENYEHYEDDPYDRIFHDSNGESARFQCHPVAFRQQRTATPEVNIRRKSQPLFYALY